MHFECKSNKFIAVLRFLYLFFFFYPSRTQMSDKGLWAETECARPAPACVHQTDCRQRENIAEAVDWAHWSQPTNRSHWKNKVLSITPPKSHISLCVSDTLEVVLLLFFRLRHAAEYSLILTSLIDFVLNPKVCEPPPVSGFYMFGCSLTFADSIIQITLLAVCFTSPVTLT